MFCNGGKLCSCKFFHLSAESCHVSIWMLCCIHTKIVHGYLLFMIMFFFHCIFSESTGYQICKRLQRQGAMLVVGRSENILNPNDSDLSHCLIWRHTPPTHTPLPLDRTPCHDVTTSSLHVKCSKSRTGASTAK